MKKISLLYKLITCIVAGFVLAALWLLIGRGKDDPVVPPILIFSLAGISLAGAVIIPFVWQYIQRKNPGLGVKVMAWVYTAIRYGVATDLAIFGWKKIFHLQFIVGADVASRPMNLQSGETLTWFYFGHSYVFGCIVAGLQLTGSAMLLFRKTWLLGAIILFTLLLNIATIDIFYQMNAGALAQSIIMLIGTIFLILIDYDRLVEFFFIATSNLVSVNSIQLSTKNIIRIAAIILPVIYTYYSATH